MPGMNWMTGTERLWHVWALEHDMKQYSTLQLQLRLSQAQCTQPKHNPCVSCSSPVLPIAPTIQDPDQPIPSVVRLHSPISTQRALHGRHFGVFFSLYIVILSSNIHTLSPPYMYIFHLVVLCFFFFFQGCHKFHALAVCAPCLSCAVMVHLSLMLMVVWSLIGGHWFNGIGN